MAAAEQEHPLSETGFSGTGLRSQLAFLTTALVILTTLTVSGWLFARFESELVVNKLEKLTEETHDQGLRFQTSTQEVQRDVAFLSGTPPIQGIIRAHQNDGVDPFDGSTEKLWRQRLETIFLNLARAKPHYSQIRYIGLAEEGRELVRVDRQGPKQTIRVVSEAELAPKGDTPYFLDTIQQPPDRVIFSRIELNRERGQISLPETPVLRASVAIYTEQFQPFGILVINQDLPSVFRSLLVTDRTNVCYLTDEKGNYILHPDPERMFRFEYGENSRIQDEFPVFGDMLNEGSATEKALIVNLPRGSMAASFRRVEFSPGQSERVVGILTLADTEDIIEVSRSVKRRAYVIVASMAGLAVLVGLFFGRRIAAPILQISTALRNFGLTEDSLHLPVRAPGEPGFLARSFLTMARRVKDQNQVLQTEVLERKRAEEEIKGILDSASDAIVTIDRAGTILSFNAQAVTMFGYTADEILGENVKLLMTANDASRHDGYLDNHRRGKPGGFVGQKRELVARRQNGETFEIELSISEVVTGGRHTFTGIIRDISERKEAARLLEETNKDLARSNAELEQFTYAASHDLQAPLRSIISFTQILEQNLEGQLAAEDKEMMDFVVASGLRMRRLINDVLELSQVSSRELPEVEVCLKEILEMVRQDLDAVIAETQAVVTSDTLPTVRGDATQLRLLLQNLIGNAIKYRNLDREARIHVGCVPDADGWRFFVKDNGVGIEEEYHGRIFDMFQRLEVEKTGGSGMGLALCKKVVERHGGRIWVDSVPGEGATFWFTLHSRGNRERE